MCEECAGCSNRSVPELFECLFSTFGEIAYRGLEKNEDNMKQLQDLETLVKVAFNCIEEATLIAAQGNDIMPKVKVATGAHSTAYENRRIINCAL